MIETKPRINRGNRGQLFRAKASGVQYASKCHHIDMYNVCKLGHVTCSGRNVYENFPAKMAPLFIASRRLAVVLKLREY